MSKNDRLSHRELRDLRIECEVWMRDFASELLNDPFVADEVVQSVFRQIAREKRRDLTRAQWRNELREMVLAGVFETIDCHVSREDKFDSDVTDEDFADGDLDDCAQPEQPVPASQSEATMRRAS